MAIKMIDSAEIKLHTIEVGMPLFLVITTL